MSDEKRSDEKTVEVSRLSVPVIAVAGVMVFLITISMAYSEYQTGMRSRLIALEDKSREQNVEILDCKNTIADTKYRFIGLERDMKYLIDAVNEIRVDVKEHKKYDNRISPVIKNRDEDE